MQAYMYNILRLNYNPLFFKVILVLYWVITCILVNVLLIWINTYLHLQVLILPVLFASHYIVYICIIIHIDSRLAEVFQDLYNLVCTIILLIVHPIRTFTLYQLVDLRRKWNNSHIQIGPRELDLSSLPFIVLLSTIPSIRLLVFIVFGAIPSIICTLKNDGSVDTVSYAWFKDQHTPLAIIANVSKSSGSNVSPTTFWHQLSTLTSLYQTSFIDILLLIGFIIVSFSLRLVFIIDMSILIRTLIRYFIHLYVLLSKWYCAMIQWISYLLHELLNKTYATNNDLLYNGYSPSLMNKGRSYHIRLYSSVAKGNKKTQDTSEDSKQISPLELWFKQSHASADSNDPTNPHIIAKRILRDKPKITLELLNSITELSLKTTISQEEFNMIESMTFTEYSLPMDIATQKSLKNQIGSSKTTLDSRISAVYWWSSCTELKDYVGGTPNAGRRIRSYIGAHPANATGRIWRAITTLGINDFTLRVSVLPKVYHTHPTMWAVAEQYWILKIDPQYNTHKVAGGGGPTVLTLSDLEK